MTKDELYKLLLISKKEGGISGIHESGFEKKFPDDYNELKKFPNKFTFRQKLYHYLNNDYELKLGLCKKCGKRTTFLDLKNGYANYCCKSCAQQDFVRMDKEGIRKRVIGFVVNNNREKAKKTCLEKYGVENPQQVKEIQKKTIDTKHKLYGEKCEEITKKIKQTKLERYGDENYNNSIKNKYTCLNKYGVENVFQSDEIRNKIKETLYNHYGVEYPLQNKNLQEKLISTNIAKYGVLFPFFKNNIKCVTKNSKPNQKFEKKLNCNDIRHEREYPINRFSYDFRVDNVLIEINPTITHNSFFGIYGKQPLTKDYHLNKSNCAKEHGLQCIHVWDWDDLDKIINMLKPKETLYARKLVLKEVSEKDCDEFLNEFHLQNTCKGQSIRIGLYKDDTLVQIMTFGKPRYNKNYELELLRLCSHKDYKIVGGAEKLFKYILDKYKPESIISYCDNSKFSGNVYERLGFEHKTVSGPSKHWYNIKTKQHITDNLLRQRGFDQLFNTNYGKGTSNEGLMLEHGFLPVYDCGQITYKYFVNKN